MKDMYKIARSPSEKRRIWLARICGLFMVAGVVSFLILYYLNNITAPLLIMGLFAFIGGIFFCSSLIFTTKSYGFWTIFNLVFGILFIIAFIISATIFSMNGSINI